MTGEDWAVELGRRRLRRLASRAGEHRSRALRQAEISEYNSLTYTALSLCFLALIAAYLMLTNAAVHTLGGFRSGYNPGLVSSLVLFFPLGGACLTVSSERLSAHLIALAIAVSGHMMILGYALLRVRRSLRLSA